MLDILGIGVGPFNLSLAALLAQYPQLNAQFFEQRENFNWHEGMLLPNTTLQVPFLADLVTLVDPTSPYSFLNYLRHQKRLLKFYFLEDFKVLRAEYNHYCQWVAKQLPSIKFASKVVQIKAVPDGFKVISEQAGEQQHLCKNLVIGTGTQPALPNFLVKVAEQYPNQCLHSANFAKQFDYHALSLIRRNGQMPKVLVLGAGQSAAEVFRELFDQQLDATGRPKYELDWRTRSAGFFPMEYSPLGLEHFSPDYLDYFYDLDLDVKSQLLRQQDLLYKGIGFSTIQDIYHKLYARTIAGHNASASLRTNFEMKGVSYESNPDIRLPNGRLKVTWYQTQQQKEFTDTFDVIIAATGYRHQLPECLNELLPHIAKDTLGQPRIHRHYQLNYAWPYSKALSSRYVNSQPLDDSQGLEDKGKIFVQNQELHSHGAGAPDLGLGAYRSACIVNQLAGEDVFDIENLQIFQQFTT